MCTSNPQFFEQTEKVAQIAVGKYRFKVYHQKDLDLKKLLVTIKVAKKTLQNQEARNREAYIEYNHVDMACASLFIRFTGFMIEFR